MTESLTRLHISPLTPALLDSVLNPSIRSLATEISFHNIATFPENDYGFVTLPTMEADKLKRKLNGSILKGKKFKVEAAREDPKKKKATKIEKDASSKPTKTSSKRKAEDAENSVLDGYELPADRRVKRGWTEPASAKRLKKQKKADKDASETKLQPKSKYTEKAECLFKTKVPPNKMSEAASKKAKSKKSSAPNEVVVHEFAKTHTHPTFLKSSVSGKTITAKFEEGKGWMDEAGNLLEETGSKKSKTADYFPGKKDGAKERPLLKAKLRKVAVKEKKKSSSDVMTSSEEEDEELDWTSSSGSSESENSASDNESDSKFEDSPSSDASSISDEMEEATSTTQATIKDKANQNLKQDEDDSTSESNSDQEDNSQVDNGTKSSDIETTTENKEVHPLEALFKRTQTEKNIPESPKPTFSFFTENDDDIEGEEEEEEEEGAAPVPLEPLTPFSKQDRQIRNLRSGAPTPDTAVFNRRKLLLSEGDIDNDEDEDMNTDDDYDHTRSLAQETPSKQRTEATPQRQPEESDFVKWFWENRGDNNRAWKRRRREAAKEKRQRENRRKGLKGRG
ncbi:uncharacterized protein BHQ10_004498 [Talaromyces amestolkiae]|uniref:Uncharacterized protein n=1 Tax=Talaromyces amestolkiae TaxID=1196081 RepID=A0A364KY46_TALAM|nr:uncharacterized protein BHQ10_004498 [Talaromyces amestolkiae]RAO68486.1 hypothetical protein BHQ10_004498 [Talaromyces amestolkiae]